jgi:fermentation-respiration switch protein FrsA (DUF1100 family)
MILRAGCAAILIDYQEHGLSDGGQNGVCYATSAHFDVIAALHFAKEKGFKRTIAMGTSMGGASVILAATVNITNDKRASYAVRPPQELVDAVIAENPFESRALLVEESLSAFLVKIPVLNIFPLHLANLMAAALWYRLDALSIPQPSEVVGKISPRPLLLMHGKVDDVISFRHSEELFEKAKEPKKLWLCDHAPHTAMYNADPRQFEEEFRSIVKQIK